MNRHSMPSSMQRKPPAPMNDEAIASALNVSPDQVQTWLQRLVDEGTLEQQIPSCADTLKPGVLLPHH